MTQFNLNDLIGDAKAAPANPIFIAEYMSYEKHIHKIKNSDQNMEERKHYASCIFNFTCVWCLFLIIIMMGQGLGKLNLSDNVILMFIGSTTLNVLVFFRLVTKYLFNSAKST